MSQAAPASSVLLHLLSLLTAARWGIHIYLQVKQGAEVAVSIMWVHPGSNQEVDFLFPCRGNQGKRYKRCRGERNVKNLASVGEIPLDRNIAPLRSNGASCAVQIQLKIYQASCLLSHFTERHLFVPALAAHEMLRRFHIRPNTCAIII